MEIIRIFGVTGGTRFCEMLDEYDYNCRNLGEYDLQLQHAG